MFKIKKNPKKATRDPLIETNSNEVSTTSQKFKGRPQSVRLNRNKTSQQTLGNQPDKQLVLTHGFNEKQTQVVENKLIDRQYLEENVRKFSAVLFKDRIALYRDVKEDLIRRVTEKALFKAQMQEDNWEEHLKTLILTEMGKIEKNRQLQRKCEERASKIEDMIEHRLMKLTSFR